MSQIPREVLQWIRNLGLSVKIRNAKWDIADGFAVVEILRVYYPDMNIPTLVHSANSLERQKNWRIIARTLRKLKFRIDSQLLEGAMNFMNDAAVLLLQILYENLKHKKVYLINPIKNPEFLSFNYNMALPFIARPTVATAIKSNLRTHYKAIRFSGIKDKKKRTQLILSHYSQFQRRWVQTNPKYERFHIPIQEMTSRITPKMDFIDEAMETIVKYRERSSSIHSGT